MLDEFAESLSTADHVYLCDIFGSAREKAGSLTINDLVNKIPGANHLDLENTSTRIPMEMQYTCLWGQGMFKNI